ncbi:hypothetical protein yberc0001_2180 [Yersinia bercovieri ATCC 43970]|uniref:Uncharacterized protein n=1 Tax=Yersinia bercovieri ATCC 43970 TaxID=349968 RepID=A0ABP2E8K1_YERBE|nr:hypothetical protein yberc0001_2180 [Yersinia bercovieri ATCC 43970]
MDELEMRALSFEGRLTINQKQNGIFLAKTAESESENQQYVISVAEFHCCCGM